MERALATIRTIDNILPIENADFIEIAKIDGWQCVVKKGEFNVGDKCVYFEIDSLLPTTEVFSFLSKNGTKISEDGSVGYRLKTIKLKNKLSQGLALPINVFNLSSNLEIGTDVTNELGIKKYEPPIHHSMQSRAKGNFPIEIYKTDETRIQNLTRIFVEHKEKMTYFNVTEKLDGASGTFYIKNGIFGACSRNYDLEYDESNLWWRIAIKYDLETKLKEYGNGRNIAIQGEIVGQGIQGNLYQLNDIEFYMFSFFDIDKQDYSMEDMYGISIQKSIPIVPQISILKLTAFDTINDILLYAEGKSQLNDKVEREGVVFASNNKEIHFKAISNKFLLNEK